MNNDYPYDAPEPNKEKPWRVSYYNHEIGPSRHAGDYRWYWQANIISWIRNNILGQGCNTWHFNPD